MRNVANRGANGGSGALIPPRLAALRRSVLRREALVAALQVLPLATATLFVAYRLGDRTIALVCAAVLLAGCVALIPRSLRRYDSTWLLRQLNAVLPAFEDSIELGLIDPPAASTGTAPTVPAPASPGGLLQLQRVRIERRIQEAALPDLRRRYPWRAVALTWSIAAVLLLLATLGPSLWHGQTFGAPSAESSASAATLGTLRVEPPAYTGLPSRWVTSLDAKVPAGSTLGFTLRLGGEPVAARLRFHDGETLELQRDGNDWKGARSVQFSTLYRVQRGDTATTGATATDALSAAPLHRIDVIPDRPPEIVVHSPERTLNLLTAGQKTWSLDFEATDDYGLGPAQLSLTLAQGSGEHIQSSQQTVDLQGTGSARHRVYRKTLDLAALGFAVGDDLIVRLSVADNHPAPANRSQSASFILRWPAQPEAASEAMEGVVQKIMPAYFSSERQLIIDTEALIAERARLEAARLARRADDLGVQQKVLRLRYGQFLGEEFESNAEHAPPGSTNRGNAALKDVPSDAPEAPAAGTAPHRSAEKSAVDIATEFGHVHDKPEAATLLDPDTRRILKSALDEMWQAELQLRQAELERALPFEHRALEYIKQVQQAERIYLARQGAQLPQVDPGRRLSGERAGLSDRDSRLPAAADGGAPPEGIWLALHHGTAPDWPSFAHWAEQHRAELPDPLGLLAAVDRVQHDPSCLACRAELERVLWPLLKQPAGAVLPRSQPDAAGTAYLDALSPSNASSPSPGSSPPSAPPP